MLIQELLIIGSSLELRNKFNDVLLEDVNKNLLSAVAAIKAKRPENVNAEVLAKIITGLKIITNAQYRSALTKGDVGINPSNVKELLAMLDTVPNAPKADLTGSSEKFFTAVCSLSKSLLASTEDMIKKATDEQDASAINELSVFAGKVDTMVTKLRAAK